MLAYRNHESSHFLVHTVFCSASLSCRNFIGPNLMFGKSFVQDYSSISVNRERQLTFCTRLCYKLKAIFYSFAIVDRGKSNLDHQPDKVQYGVESTIWISPASMTIRYSEAQYSEVLSICVVKIVHFEST